MRVRLKVRRAAGVVLALSLVTGGVVAGSSPAQAAETYQIFGTQIGIYPRQAPDMSSGKVGAALSDGANVQVNCQSDAGTVAVYGDPIWDKLTDGTWLPDYFVYTGTDGFDPRLPHCGTTGVPAPVAETSAPAPCGANEYIQNIAVVPEQGYDFKIVVTPTTKARWAVATGDLHHSTVEMWHAIQGCVPGLYDGLADSIWQQLECHQWGGLIKTSLDTYASGDTYDLESWRTPLADAGLGEYWRTHCLNLINAGGDGSNVNFPGALDLPPIPDDVA